MQNYLIYAEMKTIKDLSIDLSDLGFPVPHDSPGYYLKVTKEPSKWNTPRLDRTFYVRGINYEWVIGFDYCKVIA